MSILRDLALVVGGALVALAVQPSVSVSQSELASHAANLAAISNIMRVDQAGNVRIASKGSIAVQAANALDLKGGTTFRAEAQTVEVKAAAAARMQAASLDLSGTAQARLSGAVTVIGRNSLAPAVNVRTPIVCGPPGAPCTIRPTGGTVLIGQ